MSEKTIHRALTTGLSILLCLLMVCCTVTALSSSAKFAKATTVPASSTTRTTTTKQGNAKFSDLVVLKQRDGSWWACNKKTKVKTDYTGVAPTVEDGWWYCKSGRVDRTFTGVAENPFGLWYCRNGHVNLSFDGYFIRNSTQIYRINDGAASYYTSSLELSEQGVPDGVYKDGSKEAKTIMHLTEPLFRENISKAADAGVVRTHGLDRAKRSIVLACTLVFVCFLGINLVRDRKRVQDKEGEHPGKEDSRP